MPTFLPAQPHFTCKATEDEHPDACILLSGLVGVQIEARVHLPNEGVTKGNRDAECAPYSSSELEVA